ncbi:MAG: hypothetical protein ACREBO_11920 [Novosphingobium sp.]
MVVAGYRRGRDVSRERALPKVGKKSQHLFIHENESIQPTGGLRRFPPFSQIGTVPAIIVASADRPQNQTLGRE